MILARRQFLLAGGALALSGCATRPEAPGVSRPISLVDAFRGRSVGKGVFRVPIAGVERRFRATLIGSLRGDTLSVAEAFRFEDGEVQHLTWHFTRTGKGIWSGRRDDTVGDAQVVENGTDIRLDYTADIRSRGEVTRLSFADIVYRRDDGVIMNEAVVKKAGIRVGTVSFQLQRP